MVMAQVSAISTGATGLPLGIAAPAASGKEDFLRLLIAQLRAQSPLRPYEGQELAVQLAIFSQLEQLLSMRQLLELQLQQLAGLGEEVGNAAVPALVGAYVRVESSTVRIPADGGEVHFGYELPEAAQSVRVEICTPSGSVVRHWEFQDVAAGVQGITWDGRGQTGEQLPAGTYLIRITAVDASGRQIESRTFIEGSVEAIRFTAQGATLLVGGLELPFAKLLEVRKRP